MKTIPINIRANEDMQSLCELWDELALLAKLRAQDNYRGQGYPIEIREIQIESAQALIDAIKLTHKVAREVQE